MNETGRSILEMLQSGQITIDEAEKLLEATIEKSYSLHTNTAVPTKQLKPIPFFSWPDDKTLRIAAFIGHTLYCEHDGNGDFHVNYTGEAIDVVCYGDLTCGEVQGNVSAGGDSTCSSVGGNVNGAGDVECQNISGSVNAGGDIRCTGSVSGNAMAGGDIHCHDISGNVSSGGEVHARNISGSTDSEDNHFTFAGFDPGNWQNKEEWKTFHDEWKKQSREYREQWRKQSRDMAENLRTAAQEMAKTAQEMARGISETVNEKMRNRYK